MSSLPPASYNSNLNDRVNEILEVVISYARLDFSKKTVVLGNDDPLDAIGAGVNMLGEELESSTVSLKEKEILLKEIHHRVKNNLQIVSSLLNLQSENIIDKRYLDLIVESRNRINSMALVHEMLYSSKNFSRIEVAEYIKRLIKGIALSLSKADSKIKFNYDLEPDLYFDIDRMIPIGLILNEIISNSFKYAFSDNDGTITIKINSVKNNIVLFVSDDGIGFKKNFDFKKDSSLGIQLINMLTEQLEGKVDVMINKGVAYKISIPK